MIQSFMKTHFKYYSASIENLSKPKSIAYPWLERFQIIKCKFSKLIYKFNVIPVKMVQGFLLTALANSKVYVKKWTNKDNNKSCEKEPWEQTSPPNVKTYWVDSKNKIVWWWGIIRQINQQAKQKVPVKHPNRYRFNIWLKGAY